VAVCGRDPGPGGSYMTSLLTWASRGKVDLHDPHPSLSIMTQYGIVSVDSEQVVWWCKSCPMVTEADPADDESCYIRTPVNPSTRVLWEHVAGVNTACLEALLLLSQPHWRECGALSAQPHGIETQNKCYACFPPIQVFCIKLPDQHVVELSEKEISQLGTDVLCALMALD